MSTATLVYDDHDPSISYSTGQWGQAGVIEEYKSTTSWTSKKGATATLTFSGTSVSVWGTISNVGDAPMSSYSIDGGAEEIYNATLSKIIQYQRPFFQSKQLTPASHTLVITVLSNSENAFFFLDYISVTPNAIASSSTSSTTSSLSSTTSSSFSTLSTIVPSPTLGFDTVSSVTTTLSATTSPADSSQENLPLGPIIGGSLSGLALLIFAFIGFLFLRRKSKDRSHERNPTFTNNSSLWTRVPRANNGVTPFQPHLYHPLPDPSIYHSDSVYKQPLLPVSTPPIPTLGTAPQSKLSPYTATSQGSHSRGASMSSSGPVASTSTHQTSIPIPFEPPPPRYDG